MTFINNVLPRLKQYSEDLDKKELFIDIPWVIIDEKQNLQKYIFKRNGELIMSLNGFVSIGKWEYISSAKSLLIDRIEDKILLNQEFVVPSVMILKRDGFNQNNLILANSILLPDLNVQKYLKKMYYKVNNISVLELNNGDLLELYNYGGYINENRVAIDGLAVSDGFLQLGKIDRKLLIKNSTIVKVLINETYKTDRGCIIIEKQELMNPDVGDQVFQNGLYAPDGKYKLGFMRFISVKNGLIVKRHSF